MRALTGAPTAQYLHEDIDADYLWKKIKSSDAKKYVICTSMGSADEYAGGEAKMNRVGLFTGHAYTLIGCYEVEVRRGKKEKLVKIRNPHGNTEWTGDWSDNSPLWTRDIEDQVDLVRGDDGVFFMRFMDYYSIYHETSICKYHDDYIHTSHEVELREG